MSKKIQNISVIGDGGWGTTLAVHLAKNNHPIRLWGPFPDYVRQVGKSRYNKKFLPGIHLANNIALTESLAEAIDGYKVRHRRRFITFEEMLTVIQSLGYHR